MTNLRLATRTGGFTDLDDGVQQELAMSIQGALLKPGDAGFDQACVIYNGMFKRRPGLIIQASGTADIIDAVKLASKYDLLLAVRGGGHGVAGSAICDDGLVIDLSKMKGVHVDRKAGTVRVQGGATWGDVDRETLMYNLVTPGGVVSETGVAGLTLNGGIGWVRNKYGLSCDNLVSAEVVTATGELVTASAQENEDLLWALRGGGGNFGIVTSFEFRLNPLDPVVPVALVFYALEDGREVLRKWRDWVETTPDEATSAALIWTSPVSEHMPPPVHNRAFVVTGTVYAGDADAATPILEPLRHFATPLAELVGPLPFRAVQKAFDWAFPVDGTVRSYWKSFYANEMSNGLIDGIIDAAEQRNSQYSLINLPYFGHVVRDVPADATAFSTRSAPFMVSLDGNCLNDADIQETIGWTREWWQKLQPYSTGGVYLNFVGAEDQDAEALTRAAFGPNYGRLQAVKRKYDPQNLFRLNHNIRG